MSARELITDHLDLWTGAVIQKRSGGRGNNGKIELTGIKKLRELILELAVRGKLVDQDPSNEPASVLLARIAEEKARLIKEGDIKKPKGLLPVEKGSKPFALPEGWSWVRLGETMEMYNGKAFKSSEWSSTGLPIVRIQNLNDPHAPTNHFSGDLDAKNKIDSGTFLISWSGTPGTSFGAFIWERGPAALNQHINKCVFFGAHLNPRFMRLAVNGQMSHFIQSAQGGVGLKHVTKGVLSNALIAIPPFLEQCKIVEKVDELMALCARLEQQVGDQLEAHEVLVDTLLDAITRSGDATEVAENWARIAEHFDTLFTTEASIDKLKQAILQLAVMGRLVEQDPNDEPAESLLARLAFERQQWLESHKDNNPECATMLRKLKKLRIAKPPFPLPAGWATAHLIQLSRVLVDCHNKTAPYVEEGTPIIRTSNIRERRFRFDDLKYVSQETYQYWSRRCPPEPKDIIFTREAPMGEAAIIPEGAKWCLGQRTMLIRPMLEHIHEEYLLLALTEPHLLERASEKAIGSTVKHLRVGDVEKLSIPLPPLEEQHRIVEKIDELMALCDQLKARLSEAGETKINLSEAVVDASLS